MFTVYVREDDMGGEVFIEERFNSADAAETFAFQTILKVIRDEETPVTIELDGAFGDGHEDTWGGEFIISAPAWDGNNSRLVMEVE